MKNENSDYPGCCGLYQSRFDKTVVTLRAVPCSKTGRYSEMTIQKDQESEFESKSRSATL
jgi:hypothetical protein